MLKKLKCSNQFVTFFNVIVNVESDTAVLGVVLGAQTHDWGA